MNHIVVDTPIGPLTLVGRDGALTAVYMDAHRHATDPATYGPSDPRGLEPAAEQLGEYFAGERREFDLALDATGTPFQHQVWDALIRIPYGNTTSYGELATEIGRPGASRAVGLANGRNPISIIVPCHRVIGASGSLTGYGGGIERKAALLDLERRMAASATQLGLLDLPHGVAG